MTVDLSGPLLNSLEKSKEAYKKAMAEGNFELAKEKALECYRILKALAKNVPDYTNVYLKRAKEWKKIAENVERKRVMERPEIETSNNFREYIETLISESHITWDGIGGLYEVKKLMKETIVLSGLRKPEAIKPWKGILLFGPPGTGKTLLASASANGLHATFFNIEVGKVISKYFGESSKIISALYDVARERSPSVIFMDEFDALSIARNGDASDASKRMLSTLLTELDGFKNEKDDNFVLTLAATNVPWEIDQAILSRFPRRIYVPLPDKKACMEILKIHMKDLDIANLSLSEIAEECVKRFYSGRDIANLCQLAIWNMIRDENKGLEKLINLPYEKLKERSLNIRAMEMEDFYNAFGKVKSPLTEKDIEKYEKWNSEYGE